MRVGAARKAAKQGAGTRAGAAQGRDVAFVLRAGPALATLGDQRGGGGGLRAYYSLVDVIGPAVEVRRAPPPPAALGRRARSRRHRAPGRPPGTFSMATG